ncbi:hypothetical protein F2Q69_00052996 [Brassica cretica]|uniref:Uncharacterized protein n=1 Tax=Brassica cretica TaxID=69181 RepID=A0A8S9N5U7_BRACR|nr:hypothetical protein F2Q69_00052996 [Brassica cretica]
MEDLGNNEALMTIMSTLDHMSRKFDLYEGRFEMIDLRFDFYEVQNIPNMDQKTLMKASVDEHLKLLGVKESDKNSDNLSKGPEQSLELASPQPNTQQKSVNSPITVATPAKSAATPEAKVVATADKDAAKKREEAALTKKDAAAKKREEAALKRKEEAEKKKKTC